LRGGHHNRKTGEYHCHREPCLSTHDQVQSATKEATRSSYSTLYDRDDWGGWIDEDGDCQNTTAEILIRDSQTQVSFDGCRVVSGLWNLPYSGGSTTSASQIDIDHIIPLNWAHGHGGDRWSSERKKAFANDADNLLATSSSANRSKGAKSPGQWMPSIDKCSYARRWEGLIEKYALKATTREVAAIEKACP
jgi:hypothetical protein|tara:strand:+ start:58 stop:633 length:576 start_codon:yes stop_codon:yes gene_type:complete